MCITLQIDFSIGNPFNLRRGNLDLIFTKKMIWIRISIDFVISESSLQTPYSYMSSHYSFRMIDLISVCRLWRQLINFAPLEIQLAKRRNAQTFIDLFNALNSCIIILIMAIATHKLRTNLCWWEAMECMDCISPMDEHSFASNQQICILIDIFHCSQHPELNASKKYLTINR